MGVDWDEGPDIGGFCGPYRQSERLELYQSHAQKLLEEAKAYKCYCLSEDLARERKNSLAQGKAPRYSGKCRGLGLEDQKKLERKGIKPSIRFKVFDSVIEINDLIKGRVSFQGKNIGDFVILRSDGRASYNFAAVVDDALMEISHVIRGEDHLPNTPKQILLAQALGFKIPQMAHHPLTLSLDRGRLSKRHGATKIAFYRQEGFLPQAVVNYLALLGWKPKGKGEILSPSQIMEEFSLEGISKAPAIFDLHKLRFINRCHLRLMDSTELSQLLLPFLKESVAKEKGGRWLSEVIGVCKENASTLSEMGKYIAIMDSEEIEWEERAKEMAKEERTREMAKMVEEEVRVMEEITPTSYQRMASNLKERFKTLKTLRVILTGKTEGPELEKILKKKKKNMVLKRIERFLKEKA